MERTISMTTASADGTAASRHERRSVVPYLLFFLGVAMLLAGSYRGLFVAPAESFQGEPQRIMYIHVPTAWSTMLAGTFSFVCALAYLLGGKWKWDSRLEASIEFAVLGSLLLCIQGAIWAKPTWGVWWDWDPRLTTMAVLLFLFLGIATLRKFVDDPVKRATWSSVATIISFIDVPVVYFSVRWWNSLHQKQSSPSTISREFLIPLMTNAVAVLLIMIALITMRTAIAAARLRSEIAPPPPALLNSTMEVSR